MAWATSNISPAGLLAMVNGPATPTGGATLGPFYTVSSAQGFSTDTVNVALYGNSVVTATAISDTLAHNAYNAASGQWVQANELATATGYTQTGIAVTPKSQTVVSGNVVTFTSSGAPAWTSASFSAYGCLVYDTTITNKYVYCWNFFGGVQTVTSGTFTINWNAAGIFTVTC